MPRLLRRINYIHNRAWTDESVASISSQRFGSQRSGPIRFDWLPNREQTIFRIRMGSPRHAASGERGTCRSACITSCVGEFHNHRLLIAMRQLAPARMEQPLEKDPL